MSWYPVSLLALAIVACSTDARGDDAGAVDAGIDGSAVDAGDPGFDAGDAAEGPIDAGTDAAVTIDDGGMDASAPDAGIDDAGTDAPSIDAGSDAGTDAGGDAGNPCAADTVCAICSEPGPSWDSCTNCFGGFCYRECNAATGMCGTCRTDADCQDATRPRYSIDTPDCRASTGRDRCESVYPPLGTGYSCGRATSGCAATGGFGIFLERTGMTPMFVCCAPCDAVGSFGTTICTTRPGTGEGWYTSARNTSGMRVSCDWGTTAQGLITAADCRTDI